MHTPPPLLPSITVIASTTAPAPPSPPSLPSTIIVAPTPPLASQTNTLNLKSAIPSVSPFNSIITSASPHLQSPHLPLALSIIHFYHRVRPLMTKQNVHVRSESRTYTHMFSLGGRTRLSCSAPVVKRSKPSKFKQDLTKSRFGARMEKDEERDQGGGWGRRVEGGWRQID
ncbi:hypothetical protein Syun_012423 [Stephania yunnanensis]|uniref:Uncharacterized protein n=1 Tax=Stephania yunnanensis TaxID=152371 RepID=A0AAP0JZE0_9MAGN